MMLPFVTVLASASFAWRGRHRASVGAWLLTLAIYIAWSFYHMTDPLHLSL